MGRRGEALVGVDMYDERLDEGSQRGMGHIYTILRSSSNSCCLNQMTK